MRQAQYFNCFYFCLHLCSYWRMKWIFQNIMNRTIKLERIDCKIKNECTAVLHHCCNFDHTWQKFLLASAWSHGSFFTEKVVTCCSQAYLKFGGMAFLPPGYANAGYPKVISLATKVLCIFRTTYFCEQVFSVMNIDETKLRSTLT